MPITQQRMINLITAAERTYQAFLDLGATINAALDLRAQGLTTEEELINQLHTAAYSCTPPVPMVVLIAKERQHFNEWARRNDYHANRRAAKRGALGTQRTEGAQVEPQPVPRRPNRPGELHVISPEQVAKAQRPAFTFDPTAALATIGQPTTAQATPEQLAADDALVNDPDIQAEMAAHIAALRQGDQ